MREKEGSILPFNILESYDVTDSMKQHLDKSNELNMWGCNQKMDYSGQSGQLSRGPTLPRAQKRPMNTYRYSFMSCLTCICCFSVGKLWLIELL